MRLAQRTSWISPSATLAMDALAKRMKSEGIDVIGFGVGEPDFDTPDNVKEAAIAAIRAGFTKYTPAGGTPETKEAVIAKLARDNGLSYEPAEIIITVGAKHALFGAFQALIDPGDEVIVPAPYWVSYVDQVQLMGGKAVVIEGAEANGFKVTADQVREAITPKTRALVLNSPSNPTGAVYTRDELEAIAAVAVEADILIISDEIYEPFIYTDAGHVSVPSLGPEVKERTLLIHGVSKSHSMTGWRIGFAAGPSPIIAAMTKIQSHSTSNPTSIAQKAAVEALTGTQEPVRAMVREFARRRNYLVERLRSLPGVQCALPDGAFYAFPNISAAFGKRVGDREITNSQDFAELLLQEAHVALVPGSAFGAEGYVRLSYATSMENLKRGMDRIAEFWSRLE
ncbi:MAG: pyridoxal phosphate-dependent aminotransferase [Firmicutes bacterium]|nr:pyridoxal phosphate-dependent aminotransferase [Bacillota bacterium]